VKLGRNDPCPCGSGKKYKHCCLREHESHVVDFAGETWKKLRAAIDGYAADLLRFISQSYGDDAIQEAWFEFTLGKGPRFVPGQPNTELFFSWMFHKWAPLAEKGNTITEAGLCPSRAYLNHRPGRLHPTLQDYLEACLVTPFGFHEIHNCESGIGFTSRDVFTGAELNVRERSASSTLMDGDIVFGQIVPISGIALVEGLAPFSFPPLYKTHLVQVRQRDEVRGNADMAFRMLYFSLADAYLNPRLPELHNTDGDLLAPCTLYFDIDSPGRAFEALAPFALGHARDELLATAKFDAQAGLVNVELPWIRRNEPKHELETVVLGHIRIDGGRLTVQVNSVERAQAFRRLIDQTPNLNARYRRIRKRRLDVRRFASQRIGAGNSFRPRDREQAELMQHPEVRAHLQGLQRRHYENWPETPLPALEGRTPLEAVEDRDGREMVEALILQFERDASRLPVPTEPTVFADLRRRLGL
jgi:hypothetical protein